MKETNETVEERTESLRTLAAVTMPYKVYSSDSSRTQGDQTEWIIKGTDGKLYLVPSESGGWLRHSEYHGQTANLKAVSQEEARSICFTVYGDIGRVTIGGADLEEGGRSPSFSRRKFRI